MLTQAELTQAEQNEFIFKDIMEKYEIAFSMESLSSSARFRLDLNKIIDELLNICNTFEKVDEVELYIGSAKFIGRRQYEEVTRKEIKESILIKYEQLPKDESC